MYVTCKLVDRHLQAGRQSRRGRRPFTGKMPKKLGARPCTYKRTRRVARMAAPPAAADRSLFISTGEHNVRLVYGVRLESVVPPSSAAGSGDPITPAIMELRPSADPVVRWSEEEHRYSALAAASGGAAILALIAGSRRTVVHDVVTGTDTPGPRLRRSKRNPAMLPVGDDTVLVMDESARPGRCCFEALRRVPGGDGGWRADALPDPPVAFPDLPVELPSNFHSLCVSAYFAIGSRVWISLSDKGTLSLDTERGTWRMEGTWQLPLDGRGLFVPELGVVIGITSAIHFEPDTERCCQVCALDVDVEGGRPPAVRHVWEIPPEERVQGVAPYETAGLAHLGNGRFCISRSFVVDGRTAEGWSCEKTGTSFTLLDVSRLPGGELELAKHGNAYCHAWPLGHIIHATFLHPA